MNMTAPVLPSAPDITKLASIETEAGLIGGLLMANDHIDRVADKLKPHHFFEPLYGRIYSAICRERSLGRAVTSVTIKQYFVDDEDFKELGGIAHLATLTSSGSAIIGIHSFAEQILDLARMRLLVGNLLKVVDRATDYEIEANDLAAEAEAAIAEVMDEGADATELSAGDCIGKALEAIGRHEPGVTCGIDAFDAAQGPIRRKNLAILAGRPGMGKTAAALSYARGVAEKGHGVLFISLEMSAEELGERMVADAAYDAHTGRGVPYDTIVNARVDAENMRRLVQTQEMLADLPLEVIDIPSLKIGGLATTVRRWKRRFAARGKSLDLVIVDYLQLLGPDYRVSGPYEAITLISKGLKAIAKSNDLGVMALAQLSRKVEERADKRPQLAELRVKIGMASCSERV